MHDLLAAAQEVHQLKRQRGNAFEDISSGRSVNSPSDKSDRRPTALLVEPTDQAPSTAQRLSASQSMPRRRFSSQTAFDFSTTVFACNHALQRVFSPGRRGGQWPIISDSEGIYRHELKASEQACVSLAH